MSKKPNDKQKLTLAFLQKMEAEERQFSSEELSKASSYPLKESLKAKLSRNEFGQFIEKTGFNLYKAQNTIGINADEYSEKTSSRYRHAYPTKISSSNSPKLFSETLVDKSIQAALAAIEIYNKPDFTYREETFSILLVNAWEILLKAKVLSDSNDKIDTLYIAGDNPNEFIKSKSGNYRTINIGKAISMLELNKTLKDNLFVLIELRDNAIHFKNNNPILNIKLLEIGTASLQSYLEMCKEWFNVNLAKYNFYIMPMSFFHAHELKSYSINSDTIQNKNLIRFIGKKEEENPYDELNKHSISLTLETKFVKSKMSINPNDPKAISVKVDEEDIFTKIFTWSFKKHLVPFLKGRYSDFKMDKEFYKILKELKKDTKLCRPRYLNPKERKGSHQEWYSTNIVKEFDKYYNRKPYKKTS